MGAYSNYKLSRLFKRAARLNIGDGSKLVLISDCHRGDGENSDNYMKNQNIACYALSRYYEAGFAYLELGDGDDLWETRRFSDIAATHGSSLEWLKRFYESGRLTMLCGNHDLCKCNPRWVKKHMAAYERKGEVVPLFPGLQIHEAVALRYGQAELLLLHGHQVDPLNCEFWRLARFLVRYVWRPLELVGIKDPGSARYNPKKKKKVETKLSDWAYANGVPIIAGHTHRSAFPGETETPYFNDGSCVHPRCITAIEIENGGIALVKWSVQTDETGHLFVTRSLLEGPAKLQTYFEAVH